MVMGYKEKLTAFNLKTYLIIHYHSVVVTFGSCLYKECLKILDT